MFNLLNIAESFVETLSWLGTLFLDMPFVRALETMLQLDGLDRSYLIPPETYRFLENVFNFTVGELVFTSLIGLILGMKVIRVIIPKE